MYAIPSGSVQNETLKTLKHHREYVQQLLKFIQDLQSNVQALTEEILQVKASLATLLKVPSYTFTAPGPTAGGEDREKGAVSSKLRWNVVASRKKGTKPRGALLAPLACLLKTMLPIVPPDAAAVVQPSPTSILYLAQRRFLQVFAAFGVP